MRDRRSEDLQEAVRAKDEQMEIKDDFILQLQNDIRAKSDQLNVRSVVL